METTLLNRITNNPDILTGKPIIRGMRLSVEHVLKMLARGISHKDIILKNIPFWKKMISEPAYSTQPLSFHMKKRKYEG